MEHELKNILNEIEGIIAKLDNYNCNAKTFSEQGRKELLALFREKIIIAKTIRQNSNLKKVS